MADDARDYVAQLYQQELGRTGANDAGMQAWVDALASNAMSREAVAQAIAGSAEAQTRDIYQQELGRDLAGDAAAQNWVNAIASGALSAQQAREQIGRSQEGAQYDVARMYTGKDGLQRQGTLADVYAKDPAAKQWEQALMSGAITEQQFRDAVLGSAEYKGLTGTQTPTATTDITKLRAQMEADFAKKLADQQALYDKQLAEQATLRAQQQRTLQQSMQGNMMENAVRNAAAGQFTPTAPLASAAPAAGAPAAAPATGLPSAAPVAAAPADITPAPTMYVPQTYLAPAPPQYRGFSPFQVPFQGPTANPFESYFAIASRRRPGMTGAYMPVDGSQAGVQGFPTPQGAYMGPPAAYSFYSPFAPMQPAQSAPASPPPVTTTPTT
jgi:hypothetical protein